MDGDETVYFAMGCHPKSVSDFTVWAEQGLRRAMAHPKAVALGEIGLDYSKQSVVLVVVVVAVIVVVNS